MSQESTRIKRLPFHDGLVGVVAGDSILQAFLPRKDLLLFDRIAFIGLDRFIRITKGANDDVVHLGDEYEFLRESGLVFDPLKGRTRAELRQHESFSGYLDRIDALDREVERSMNTIEAERTWGGFEGMERFRQMSRGVRYFESMAYTSYLAKEMHYDACCILDPEDLVEAEPLTKSAVAIMALERFPVPHEDTPWENITAFRNDPDSKERCSALRLWLRETAKGASDLHEVRDRLDYHLQSYENALRFYEMKYHRGVLKTVIVTAAEILEDLVKVRWSNITKSLFGLRDGRVELLEAERKAPGRELSYIIKAKKEFR